jgi:hypothetical protein
MIGTWKFPELGPIGGGLIGAMAYVAQTRLTDRTDRVPAVVELVSWFAAIGAVLGAVMCRPLAADTTEWLLATVAVGAGFAGIGLLLGGVFALARRVGRLAGPIGDGPTSDDPEDPR